MEASLCASFLLILVNEGANVNFVWTQTIQLQGDQRKNVSTFLVQVYNNMMSPDCITK